MKILIVLLSISAICTIFYALFRVVTLTKRIPRGLMKQYWKLFYYLIGLLSMGYFIPQAAGDVQGTHCCHYLPGRSCVRREGI